MRNHFQPFALASLCILAVVPARAAFDPAIVSADAQWVVYLDMAEFRETVFGREMIALTQKKLGTELAGAPVRVDVAKILALANSVTAYGASFSTDPKSVDGTLVISAGPELRKIAEGIVAQTSVVMKPDHVVEITDLPFEAHLIHGEIVVGFPKEPIVLISKSKAQVLKAYNVFRGSAPSLAKATASPLRALITPRGRSYFVSASVMPSEKDNKMFKLDGPESRMLKLASSGAVMIGEADQKTTLHSELMAASDDSAKKLHKIVEGMTAMMSLAESNDRQLAEFLQSAAVTQNGRAVSLDLSYSSQRLATMIKSLLQAQEQMRAPPPTLPGKQLAEWKLQNGQEGVPLSKESLAERKIENVRLVTGATILLGGRREGGGMGAMFDSVEIIPADGSSPGLRFEAENMRLMRYRPMNLPFASNRSLIGMSGNFAMAQFEFPGAEGNYTLNIHYVEESGAKSTLMVAVRDPAPPPPAGK
ncbi:MAG TPA: hypothetical protein VM029_20255 [Opitutaceae bacterium]|nr:hypothetical protein [Opitutaceae bacterium]